MSNYTPLTNFGAKDTLPSGNAAKVVRGSEFTIEFNNIASSIATKAEANAPSFTSDATFGGNIIVNGTVDGRDVLTDGNKLDTIETSATADQTDGEIRALVESASNSNVFTDADHSKLDAIEASADVTDTVNVTAAGAAMLTGASFTGNVSTTGTLATGGFTLPATDGTAGQALLTNGSGAVAWADVTVDISGKANLSGAAFTGDISLDTDAVFLSDTNDFGGKGRIGIGTNTPAANLDIVADNGVSIRLNSLEGKNNVISFKDTTNNENPVKITGTHNDVYYGTNKTGGILTLTAQIDSGGSNVDINNFELRPSYTFSTKPIHVLGDNPPNVSVSAQASSAHGNFIAEAGVTSKATVACPLDTQTTFGGASVYEDGMLVAALKLGGSGYLKTTSIRADGEGSIALYDEINNTGVKYSHNVFEPCATTTVPDGTASGTFTRYLAGTNNYVSQLGRSTNRWSNIYLLNNPDVASDQRLKQNIADADDAGSTIDAIQVRKFDWIKDGRHQSYGMIAQELAEVYPEAVSVPENEEDTLGIATGDLIPMLIKEVQSLRSRVAELESE
jgi:hypothetical protein